MSHNIHIDTHLKNLEADCLRMLASVGVNLSGLCNHIHRDFPVVPGAPRMTMERFEAEGLDIVVVHAQAQLAVAASLSLHREPVAILIADRMEWIRGLTKAPVRTASPEAPDLRGLFGEPSPDSPAVGARVFTMCHGHVVEATVIAADPVDGQFTGSLVLGEGGSLCLDFGQRWYVQNGHRFTFGVPQMKAARESLAQGRMPVR